VKVRRPKSEGRKKSEGRSPKAEDWSPSSGAPARCEVASVPSGWPPIRRRCARASSGFGFRTAAFLRVSRFGFRVFCAATSLLAARPLFALVTNAPANDEIPRLRPPHAEIPATFWDQYGTWVILAGVAALALIGAAVWFFTRPKPPVVVPPEVLARRALEPLRHQVEDGALLSRVSQVLRHYLAAAFDLPPGELTTAEFCGAITGHPLIGPELSAAFIAFLRLCDRDKFSPPAPIPPLSAVAQALRLIEQSQARRTALAQAAAQPPPKTLSPPLAARA